MKTHVVVTHYDPVTRPIVMHAYGPMTEDQAKRERRRILAENADDALRGRLHVSACRMLDLPREPAVGEIR